MDEIKLYEIDGNYINFLLPYAPHLFQNRKSGQKNERKYIGIVLRVNGFDYFAPLPFYTIFFNICYTLIAKNIKERKTSPAFFNILFYQANNPRKRQNNRQV